MLLQNTLKRLALFLSELCDLPSNQLFLKTLFWVCCILLQVFKRAATDVFCQNTPSLRTEGALSSEQIIRARRLLGSEMCMSVLQLLPKVCHLEGTKLSIPTQQEAQKQH